MKVQHGKMIHILDKTLLKSMQNKTITYTYQNKPRYFNIVIKYVANFEYENLFTDELLLNDYGKVVSKNGTDLNVNGYPATYYKIHQPLFKQLLEKLEAGELINI